MKVFVILQACSVIVNPLILNPTFVRGAPTSPGYLRGKKKSGDGGLWISPVKDVKALFLFLPILTQPL